MITDIESFNYLDENDKPRDTEFGLNMQIDSTEKTLSRLKRKLYKANLTDVERHNAKTYIDYYTDLLDIYKTKLSDISSNTDKFNSCIAILPLTNNSSIGILSIDDELVKYMYSYNNTVFESSIEYDKNNNPYFTDQDGLEWNINDFIRTNYSKGRY